MRGPRLGAFGFVVLFLASIAVVGGPFWSRYYAHVVGPWLVAAAPALGRLAIRDGSLAFSIVYLAATASVSYAMLTWMIF